MRLPTRPLLFLGLLAAWVGVTDRVVTAQNLVDVKTLEVRTDRWVEPYVRAGDFSGVVLIAQGDRILVQKAYGKADFRHGTQNQLATQFRVASLSKTFTAAAIENLIREGKVHLSDTLDQYIPGVPSGEKVTIEQLLLHRSGVGELDDANVYRTCLPGEELIRRIRKTKPLFAPGSDSQYSNEGYFLLAMVVEKSSGEPFAEYLRKEIFDPLQMASSGVSCQWPLMKGRASGYVPAAGTQRLRPLPFPEAAMEGAGSAYSSAKDLYRWLTAIATDPKFDVARLPYPYGWGKRNYSGRDLIEQSGTVEGYFSHIALYPKENIYAVILSNIQSGLLGRVPKDLEAVLFGGTSTSPPVVHTARVSAAQLQKFTGKFKATEVPVPQELLVRGGHLYMHWGKYPFLRVLTPIGNDEFYFRQEYAEVHFERDQNENITKMSWKWPEGEAMSFKKLE